MMRVEPDCGGLNASAVLAAVLHEFSAITDYRTLRDSLPRRLASFMQCRSVLIYQRVNETLQLVAGSFDDKPGWSASLLAVAHINPISLGSDTLEARAWRERHAVTAAIESSLPTYIAVPLIYRQRAFGVLVAIRGGKLPLPSDKMSNPDYWLDTEIQVVDVVASVVAMLLENTRLLERDRERIAELSLLNSISSQMNSAMHDVGHLRSVIIQRTREISSADLCELLLPATPTDAISWISPSLSTLLMQYVSTRRELHPLILERPGDVSASEYLDQLPSNIKTFFAVPLASSRSTGGRRGFSSKRQEVGPKVLGVVVGGYYRPWKLRREELVLLQVLANQASAVLENMSLMGDVVEARNEARKLLRQVLDDQRLKELILESIPSGLITVNLAGQITTFNRAAEAILGYDADEVLGQPIQRVLQSDAIQRVVKLRRVQSETLGAVNRRGQEVVLDATFLPLRDDRNRQIGVVATFNDVTVMHRLEEEKRRLDRLASLGEMAASVAHEVRNPLASIKTSMQMLMDDLSNSETIRESQSISEEVQESVAVVLKEAERLDTIVRDLLLFARPRQLHLVECNMMELGEYVLQLIQPQCVEAGVVVHRVYHDVPLVRVDLAQMEQVLFNLYMNALQAMPDGGVLTVSCRVVDIEAASPLRQQGIDEHVNGESNRLPARGSCEIRDALELRSSLTARNKQQRWLEFSVSDTGVGIPGEQLERIFQPFFTTKAHGIGLGLPITRRLVEDHNGYILVESQFGYGATIIVRLPLDDI